MKAAATLVTPIVHLPRVRACRAAALAIPLLVACEAGSNTVRVETRDSAGVEIVENTPGRKLPVVAWQILSEPILRIGGRENRHAELSAISDLTILPNGTIVIAQSEDIAFVGPTGEFAASVHRPGNGPGEFRYVQTVRPYPGNLVAAYATSRRIIILFDANGRHVRDLPLRVARTEFGPASSFIGATTNGSAVFGHYGPSSMTYVAYGPDDERGDTIGIVSRLGPPDPMPYGAPTVTPLSPRYHAVIRDDLLYSGFADRYEIQIHHTMTGDVTRLIRNRRPRVRITEQDIERVHESVLQWADSPEQQRAAEQRLAETEWPEEFPAYVRILVDPAGYSWVFEGGPLAANQTHVAIYEPDGALLGAMDLRPEIAPFEVGLDRVVSLRFDEMQVPEVLVYALDRSR